MRRSGSRVFWISFSLLVSLLGQKALAGSDPVSPQWAAKWRSDLQFIKEALSETHPDPFTKVSAEDFHSRVEALGAKAAELSHEELIVGLSRIVAAIGDGHTRLTLPVPESSGFFLGHTRTEPPAISDLLFHPLPIRLHYLDGGLFVRSASADLEQAVNAQVLGIGDASAEDAAAAVAPVVHRDNEAQLRFQLPDYLVLPEVLAATGVIQSPGAVSFRLQHPGEAPFVVTLEPMEESRVVELVDGFELRGVDRPLYLRDNTKSFWFEALEAERAVYLQFNAVYPEGEESIREMAGRLVKVLDEPSIERLVIDLRWNRGGSSSLARPLLHRLMAHPKLQKPGSLFAIIGPATFSAAMMFSVDLELHTPTLFVGEPTGSSPNHFGDSRKIRLPETGLTVRVSTLYWQKSDPRDLRTSIEPHLPSIPSIQDFAAGRDPVLDAILKGDATPSADLEGLEGRWAGRITFLRTPLDFAINLEREATAEGGWAATLDAPALGLEQAPLEEVRVDPDQADVLKFRLQTPGGLIDFSAQRQGRRIFGSAVQGGYPATPFVLTGAAR